MSKALAGLSAVARWLEKLGWIYGLCLGIMVLSLWAFGELAEEVLETEMAAFNQAVLLSIHGHATPFWDQVALHVTQLGSILGIVVLGSLFGLWMLSRRRYLDLAALLAALLGGGLLTYSLKTMFKQLRPDVFPQLVVERSFSFPSGHALLSFCLWGFLGVWLILENPRAGWRWAIAALCMAVAGLIALSRLYLGVHWPTDVTAGFLLACTWLSICFMGRHWVSQRSAPKEIHRT